MRGLVVASFFICLFATSAAADIVASSGDETIADVAHDVRATVDGDQVTFRVRRTVKNNGTEVEEANLRVGLPAGGAVRGMRVHADGRWSTATLLPTQDARQRYQNEQRRPTAVTGHPALTTWSGTGHVNTRVYPIAPGASVIVEYTILAPTERENGRARFSYPRGEAGEMPPTLTVDGPSASQRVWIDGTETTSGRAISLARPLTRAERLAKSRVDLSLAVERERIGTDDKAVARLFFTHPEPDELKIVVVNPAGRMQVIDLEDDAESGIEIEIERGMLAELKGQWTLVAADLSQGEHGTIHGWRLALGDTESRSRRAFRLPDASDNAEPDWYAVWDVEVETDPKTIDVTRSVAPLDKTHQMTRVHVDLPNALAAVPDDLRVAFLIDASRSRSDEHIRASLDVIGAYLEHAPTARFEIIRYDRAATRLVGRFAAASDFAAERERLLAGKALVRKNGSHLDVAINAAVSALSTVRGTRRVVVISDGEQRSRYKHTRAIRPLRRLGRDVVLHGVDIGYLNDRDDRHPLAALAKLRGGIAMGLRHDDDDPSEMVKAALALVRPVRIDNLRVEGGQIRFDHLPTQLAEGDGLRVAGVSTGAPILVGERWSTRVTFHPASRDGGVLAAALTFGDQRLVRQVAAHVPALATLGHALSSATSFLSVRPGVRPRDGIGFGYLSARGGSRCGGVRTVIVPGPTKPVGAEALAAPLATCTARVRPAQPTASVVLETTGSEIVDVSVSATSARFARCLEREIWNLELVRPDARLALETHAITLAADSPRQ